MSEAECGGCSDVMYDGPNAQHVAHPPPHSTSAADCDFGGGLSALTASSNRPTPELQTASLADTSRCHARWPLCRAQGRQRPEETSGSAFLQLTQLTSSTLQRMYPPRPVH